MINSIKHIPWVTLPVLFMTLTGFVDTSIIKDVEKANFEAHYFFSSEVIVTPCESEIDFSETAKECTVKIKTEDMDLEITLHDVSRWDCFKLKAKALWARITGDI